MIDWIKQAVKWIVDNNTITHAFGFAFLGAAFVYFWMTFPKPDIGGVVTLGGFGGGLVGLGHAFGK